MSSKSARAISPVLARWTVLAILFTTLGCATPIGVTREDPTILYRALTRSVLSADEPSELTQQLLRRRGLEEAFEKDPEATLAEMHRTLGGVPAFAAAREADRLFALAELSFIHGRETNKREYLLAAAVYAYAFLASEQRRAETLPAADPRVRWAADLYNVAMTFGLQESIPSADGIAPPRDEVNLTSRTLPLPFGALELQDRGPETFLWGGYRFARFIPLIEYKVRGLKNRYRQAGLGVSLAAEVEPVEGPGADEARKRIPPRVKVPITAFVELPNVRKSLDTGHVRGIIDLHAIDAESTVQVEGVAVPLEQDPTAALALGLEGARVWDSEFGGFLRAGRTVFGDGLIMMHPYRPGRTPVVLVHGTASSPARWAEIINEVQNDPSLESKVQIWLFMYNTSNPILYSADLLRRSLEKVVADFDPDGKDPALRQMVVMGHSQGGLLTRLIVTDSGNRFWANVSNSRFDDVKMSPGTRDLMRRAMFFEPVPFVKRVVFLATPHRGSFRVSTLVMGAVRRLVTLPVTLVRDFTDIAQNNPELATHLKTRRLPTAVDNMFGSSTFVRALSECPIGPGVAMHSIIAVQGRGDPRRLNDGVVAYESAHLDGVESEIVVKSPHSLQTNPETILEVRRILREHVGVR